jgi:hypothetical protein
VKSHDDRTDGRLVAGLLRRGERDPDPWPGCESSIPDVAEKNQRTRQNKSRRDCHASASHV